MSAVWASTARNDVLLRSRTCRQCLTLPSSGHPTARHVARSITVGSAVGCRSPQTMGVIIDVAGKREQLTRLVIGERNAESICHSGLGLFRRDHRGVLRAHPANRADQEVLSAVVPIGGRSTPRLLYLRKPFTRGWEPLGDHHSKRHAHLLCGKTRECWRLLCNGASAGTHSATPVCRDHWATALRRSGTLSGVAGSAARVYAVKGRVRAAVREDNMHASSASHGSMTPNPSFQRTPRKRGAAELKR